MSWIWFRTRMFLDLQDPDPPLFVRIRVRIILSSIIKQKIKKVRKTLVSAVLWLFKKNLSLKNDVYVPYPQKLKRKKLFLDLESHWQIEQVLIRNSVVRIHGSGFTPIKMSRIHNTGYNFQVSSVGLDIDLPPPPPPGLVFIFLKTCYFYGY